MKKIRRLRAITREMIKIGCSNKDIDGLIKSRTNEGFYKNENNQIEFIVSGRYLLHVPTGTIYEDMELF